jgi:hypothetical protein
VSAARIRKASHPRKIPGVMQASVPPLSAQVTAPQRIIWNAWPIAWVAEAQALETANVGPVMPSDIETWLAGAFAIVRGMVIG